MAVSEDGEAYVAEVMARLIARLRIEREACPGLTQETLASRLGVKGNSLREWEAVREYPTLVHLICWASEFGLRLAVVDSERREQSAAVPEAAGSWAEREVRRLTATLCERRNRSSDTQLWLSGVLGVSQMTVSRWETGGGRPRPASLVRWARGVGLSVVLVPV